MTKKILFILSLICPFCVSSCQQKPVIHQIYVDTKIHHKDTIQLSDYTDFEWDRALLFMEEVGYIMNIMNFDRDKKDSLEQRFSINFEEVFPYKSKKFYTYEFSEPLLFMKGGKIVHIEKNYNDTFPDDEKGWEEEQILLWTDKDPIIYEIKRDHCRFKAKPLKYKTIGLTHIQP